MKEKALKRKVKPNIPKEHRAQIKLPQLEVGYIIALIIAQILVAAIILILK